MLTLPEIRKRLLEIHSEYGGMGDDEMQAAIEAGDANPCGCAICDLIRDIGLEMYRQFDAETESA